MKRYIIILMAFLTLVIPVNASASSLFVDDLPFSLNQMRQLEPDLPYHWVYYADTRNQWTVYFSDKKFVWDGDKLIIPEGAVIDRWRYVDGSFDNDAGRVGLSENYIVHGDDLKVPSDFTMYISWADYDYLSKYTIYLNYDILDTDGNVFFSAGKEVYRSVTSIPQQIAGVLVDGGLLSTGLIVLAILLGISLVRRFPFWRLR